MVEKCLEDIAIRDAKYIDPLFCQGLYEHMKKVDGSSLEMAWNYAEKICSAAEFRSYLEHITTLQALNTH